MRRVRFGSMLYPAAFEDMIKQSRLMEQCGLDSLWFPDHIVFLNTNWIGLDAWCTLSALTNHVKRMTLGTAVTDPLRRHPAVFAQTVATLDQISKGRAVVGIGAGEAMNIVPFGIEYTKRVLRMRETIQVARRLWTGKPIDFHGEFYRLNNAFIQAIPCNRSLVPIYIAANSPRTRKVAGELGDGWIAQVMCPEKYRTDLKEVYEAAEKADRDPSVIDIVYCSNLSISKDYDEARASAIAATKQMFVWWPKQLERYGAWVDPSYDWNRLTVCEDTLEKCRRRSLGIPDEIAEQVSIFGRPRDCVDRISEYVRSGVNSFLFEIQSPLPESYDLLRREVLPFFAD